MVVTNAIHKSFKGLKLSLACDGYKNPVAFLDLGFAVKEGPKIKLDVELVVKVADCVRDRDGDDSWHRTTPSRFCARNTGLFRVPPILECDWSFLIHAEYALYRLDQGFHREKRSRRVLVCSMGGFHRNPIVYAR